MDSPNALQDIEDTIQALNAEIADIDKRKEALWHRRNILVLKANQYKNAHAPVAKLSVDVMREIFKYFDMEARSDELQRALPSPEADEARTLFNSRRDILNLTHVCSAWRQTAIGFAQLWSTVHFTDNFSDDWYIQLHKPTIVQFIHEWLSRAGKFSRTLYVYIDNRNSLTESRLDAIQRIFTTHTFRKLFIYCSFLEILHRLFALPNRSLLLLEDLSLNWSEQSSEEFLPVTRHLFLDIMEFPSLHNLEIQGDQWNIDNIQSTVPLAQLQHLTISFRYALPSQLLDTARQCLSLERLALWHSCDEPVVIPDAQTDIVLPKLQQFTLALNGSHSGIVAELWLRLLVIPSVERLVISSPMPTGCHTSTWLQLIKRSSGMAQLRRISIYCPQSLVDIGALLGVLPRLEFLEVDSDNTALVNESTLSALAVGKLGPALYHIKLNSTFHLDVVVRLVKLRHQSAIESAHDPNRKITQFRHAYFRFYKPTDEHMRGLLSEVWHAKEAGCSHPLYCLYGVVEDEASGSLFMSS